MSGISSGDGWAAGNLDDMGEGPGFRKVRQALGVTAFGVNAVVVPPGYASGRHLHERLGVTEFLVQPSARNPRAIRAYERAGFRRLGVPIVEARDLWGPSYYDDSVYMVRSMTPQGDGADRP